LRDQLAQARQEPRQRLARAGGGDQQRAAARAGGAQHVELVAAGRPPALREPAGDHRRQRVAALGARR
jgi:hypothetical protein